MRRLATALLVLAGLMAAIRLFTGIDRRADSALAYLVLKPVPDLAIERDRVGDAESGRVLVLDDDELDLAYGPAYRALMAVAPAAALLLAAAGGVLLLRARPRRR